MTKTRAPLTFDNALVKIAALIGWEAMAAVVEKRERTVRNWSDPDTGEQCPIGDAHKLDLAYQAAGGEGAPMFETYALLLEVARAERFADQAELARRLQTAMKETAEAHSAILSATIPGADLSPQAVAQRRREVEEGIASLTATLPLLADDAGSDSPAARERPEGGQ